MHSYEYFYNLGCFTREDASKIASNPNTVDSTLFTYKKKGLIKSVKRNLYVAVSRETKTVVATPFEIASKITADSFVSHHSAFEYYGMANQVFSDINVSTTIRFNDFEFDGKTFQFIKSKMKLGIISATSRVRITDLERTIIDSIKDFNKIGGLEELLRCLEMVTYVDEKRLLLYLEGYDNQFLYQKTGYILMHYQKSMKLSEEFFEKCNFMKKSSIRYLYDDIKPADPIYNSKWQMYVPADLMKLIDEGGNEIV